MILSFVICKRTEIFTSRALVERRGCTYSKEGRRGCRALSGCPTPSCLAFGAVLQRGIIISHPVPLFAEGSHKGGKNRLELLQEGVAEWG